MHVSRHFCVLNSSALKALEISQKTEPPAGGVIHLDKSGEPNGILQEANALIDSVQSSFDETQWEAAIKRDSAAYLSVGVTTTVIAGGGAGKFKRFAHSIKSGNLKIRVVLMPTPNVAPKTAEILKEIDPFRLKAGATKIFHDGSNLLGTAYMTEPYLPQLDGRSNNYGQRLHTRPELCEKVLSLHQGGFQIAIHGNGDAAIDDIIFAYKEAQKKHPRGDSRHRIEHCQVTRQDQLDQIKSHRITPSYFSGHVYYWGDHYVEVLLGKRRSQRISPLASSLQRSIPFTIPSALFP